MEKIYDCIIIGAGPAGLTAGLYLARFYRKFLIFDNHLSRAQLIPKSHNYPGYPRGIRGETILKKLREQLNWYDVKIKRSTIVQVQKAPRLRQKKSLKHEPISSLFVVRTQKQKFMAKTVIFATGLEDIEPALPGLKNAIKKGLIRHCLICDAYEVSGKKLAVIGTNTKGLNEALFLSRYSEDVTLLTLGKNPLLNKRVKAQLALNKIRLIEDPILQVIVKKNKIALLRTSKGSHNFYAIYSALGSVVHSQLAEPLEVKLGKDQCIKVNKKQETNIKGIYAIGDVVEGLNQISVAIAQGAIAASNIHNTLSNYKIKRNHKQTVASRAR